MIERTEISHPASFLVSLGGLIEALSVVPADPEARIEAVARLEAALATLLRQNTFPAFFFRDDGVEYEGERLEELREWKWSQRLAEAGVHRLEISPGTTREDLEGFVEEVAARVFLTRGGASVRELPGQSGLRFGELDVAETDPGAVAPLPQLAFDLGAEAETVAWLNGEVVEHGVVPTREASAVVHLLSVAMHSERDVVIPLVQLRSVDEYTTAHSINVSCLSMALAEHLRLSSVDVRAIGEAALLHDVGKSRIPAEVLNKQGKLTESEWKLIQQHTVEGAKILLASGRGMELAATVAYEHHLSLNGEGYPKLTFERQTHEVSRLVQVCDVYDALRTRRPFRPPWPAARALKFLEDKAGTHLDPQYADAFLQMIPESELHQVDLERDRDVPATQ